MMFQIMSVTMAIIIVSFLACHHDSDDSSAMTIIIIIIIIIVIDHQHQSSHLSKDVTSPGMHLCHHSQNVTKSWVLHLHLKTISFIPDISRKALGNTF